MNPQKAERSLRDRLGAVSRRSISVTGDELVRHRPLSSGRALPELVEPALEGVDLVAWAAGHREWLDDALHRAGGVLCRGFGVRDEGALQRLVEAVSGNPLEYSYRSTPRTRVAGNIYTSTEYPADQQIPMHNEMSYTTSWPMRIFFLSAVVAAEGGETPIADSREVYRSIPEEVRAAFEAHGVMYVRNYGGGMDLPWSEVFQTADRAEVETFCAGRGIRCEWLDGERLRTRQVCQATARHPVTGEPVWFNQAHLFHVSSLDPETREALLAEGEENLPRNTYLGDGSPIPEDHLEAIRGAFDRALVVFPWQQGDVLILDNMLAAHGRRPYSGPRRVLVGMSEEQRA